MRPRSTFPLLTLSAVVLASSALQSQAAVRKCGPAIASEIAQADNEFLGKRKALLSWTQRAARLGPDYASWRLADKKILGCKAAKSPSSGVQCVAYATPCTLQQNPANPKARKPGGRKATMDV